ncbi:MAG: O-antigen ligase family protein [Candidatus Omnitrophota bacterium]
MFLLASDTFRSQKRLITGIHVLIFSSFSVFVSVVTQVWLGKDFLRGRTLIPIANDVTGITGAFNSHNDLGCYLALILLLAIACFLIERGRKLRLFMGVWSVVISIGLLLTFSRGSWFNFTVAMVLFLILLRDFTGRMLLKVVALWMVLVIVVLTVPALKARFFLTFTTEGDALRFSIWRSCWQMIKEHILLGRGLGTFMSYFPSFSSDFKSAYYAHNCYLQMWVESGVFSLLAFLAFIGSVFVSAWNRVRRSRDVVRAALIAGCAGFLAHSFFDTQLYSLQLSALFWILLGMTATDTGNSPEIHGQPHV